MWMAGSLKNECDDAPDRRTDSAAAADRRHHADARRETSPAESQDQPVLQPAGPGHLRDAAAMDANHRRAWLHWGVPAGQLAITVRHRAGGRSSVGDDAGADRDHRRQRPAVRHGPLGRRLFELFVFFEVLLAASYGLMLHGSGRARVSSGLHYISINLLASSLFLIGAALIYGVTGTLNMADLALKIPLVPEADRGLLHAGAAILATAFLAKAGMWPLNFWLVPAYSAASAPVAAMFAIMTKVGVYTLLRLWTLLFSGQAGASSFFGGDWLIYGGMATILTAAVAILAAQRLERMASLSILVSAGILLSAIGFAQPSLTAGALFYLVSSTLALSALFLLSELIERSRSANEIPLDDDADQLPRPMESLNPPPGTNLDGEQKAVVGQVIPKTMAFLGLSFIACALLIIGMPPLSGFIGKLTLLSALLNPLGLDVAQDAGISASSWALVTLLIVSGLTSLLAFSRVGIKRFWTPQERPSPLLSSYECLPIVILLGLSIALTFNAEPLMRYTQAAATALNNPEQYVMAVLGTRSVPSPEAKAAMRSEEHTSELQSHH